MSTNTSGLSWEDNIDIDYTFSSMTCGDGNDEECFTGECFQHTIL